MFLFCSTTKSSSSVLSFTVNFHLEQNGEIMNNEVIVNPSIITIRATSLLTELESMFKKNTLLKGFREYCIRLTILI